MHLYYTACFVWGPQWLQYVSSGLPTLVHSLHVYVVLANFVCVLMMRSNSGWSLVEEVV